MLLTIHTDGGGQPPKTSCGFYATDGFTGEFIAAECYTLGEETTNEAEYAGVYAALRWALRWSQRQPVSGLHIVSDSQLIVNQMNRAWRTKESRLEECRDRAIEMAGLLDFDVKYTWVRRGSNKEADLMATVGKRDQGRGWLLRQRARRGKRRVRKEVVACGGQLERGLRSSRGLDMHLATHLSMSAVAT